MNVDVTVPNPIGGTLRTLITCAAIVAICIVGWRCQVDTNAATVACVQAGANPTECREAIE